MSVGGDSVMDIVVLLGIVALSLSLAAGLAGGVLYMVFSLMGLAARRAAPAQPVAEAYAQPDAMVDRRLARPMAA
jgi:hypothetical protein